MRITEFVEPDFDLNWEGDRPLPPKNNTIMQCDMDKVREIAARLQEKAPYAVGLFKQGKVLFRGVKRGFYDYTETIPHPNRKPMSTKLEHQQVFDKMLSNQGFTALRSNSIFCTGDPGQARLYSDTIYIVFPFSPFHFTWSPVLKDLFNDISRAATEQWVSGAELNLAATAKQFVEEYRFQKTNFATAIDSNHEIYIRGMFALVEYDRVAPFLFNALSGK